jgi:hypothetical protein
MDSQNTDPNKQNVDTPTIYGEPTAVGFDSVYKYIDNLSKLPLDTKPLDTKPKVTEVLKKGSDILGILHKNKKNVYTNLEDFCTIQLDNIIVELTKLNETKIYKPFDMSEIPRITDLIKATEPYIQLLMYLRNTYKNDTSSYKRLDSVITKYKTTINLIHIEDENRRKIDMNMGGRTLRKRKGKGKRKRRKTVRKGKRRKTVRKGKGRRNTRKH